MIVHTRIKPVWGQWWPLNILQHFTRDLVFRSELEDYYELAAIATVGDVMDLQGENRILVKKDCTV